MRFPSPYVPLHLFQRSKLCFSATQINYYGYPSSRDYPNKRCAMYKIQHPGMPHKVRCPPAQYSTRRFLQQRSEINYTQQYGKTHVQTICPGDNRSYIATPGSCRHRALAQDVYECFRRTRQKQLSSARIR